MLDFLSNYDSTLTIGQLSVPDFISLMLFVFVVLYGLVVMSGKVLNLLISLVRFFVYSIRDSGKDRENS